MFEYMGDRLSNAIKNIRGMGRITEDNINDAMKEIRMALLEADVNYQVVKEFIANVKEKALGMEVGKSLKPDELFIKIVKDELVELLGGEAAPLYVDGRPTILMLVGLQGSGKTTTAGKLANYLRKKNSKKPLLVACDIYRPAAIEQLETIGKQLNIPVYSEGKKPVLEIIEHALSYAKENNNDYVIIDTAGRLHIDDELMDELKDISSTYKPPPVQGPAAARSLEPKEGKHTVRPPNAVIIIDAPVKECPPSSCGTRHAQEKSSQAAAAQRQSLGIPSQRDFLERRSACLSS